jgi:AraC family transcriptional regulator
MQPRESRSEYERRIHRVLAHIDAHLGEPLALETLAAVAHFSPFHFHRLFTAWCGETLGDYLRRRRLEIGALRLATQPQLGVLDVALGVGFGSGEAFARAFKQRFGASPSEWRTVRKDGKPGQADRKIDQAGAAASDEHGFPATPVPEEPMNVTLVDRLPVEVVYQRYTGPYGPDVGRFWFEQVAPWMATNGLLGKARYGVSHDDPDITDRDKCRYDACIEVAPGTVLSGQPMRTTLAGGRYACTRFVGTVETINDAWRALLRGWLPGSGLQLDARPFLEHYPVGSSYDPATGVFDCELCIPVSPL